MSISDPVRAKLRCLICNTPTTVVDSQKSGTVKNAIRRRRRCPECEARFTTIEIVVPKSYRLIKNVEVEHENRHS